jgi:hypothetical protein
MRVIPTSNSLAEVFSFPHPANEIAARMVAGMVVTLSVGIIVFQVPWLMYVLAYGFLARVLTGPSLSPMGMLATRVLVPLFGNHVKEVAGPPKRFAQAVGLVFSVAALLLYYTFGLSLAAYGVLGVLAFFAVLEAAVGFCTGCFVFGYMMRWGIIPEETCEKCNNLQLSVPDATESLASAP